jgi:hypothetical protein
MTEIQPVPHRTLWSSLISVEDDRFSGTHRPLLKTLDATHRRAGACIGALHATAVQPSASFTHLERRSRSAYPLIDAYDPPARFAPSFAHTLRPLSVHPSHVVRTDLSPIASHVLNGHARLQLRAE